MMMKGRKLTRMFNQEQSAVERVEGDKEGEGEGEEEGEALGEQIEGTRIT